MQVGETINLPSDYNFFISEGQKISREVFYQNLQHSGGKNSSFNSLDLIFFENRKYDFLNTGFVIVPQMNSKLMGKPISTVPVLNNNTWKADGIVDFATYNPRYNAANFMYMIIYLNMTNEQVLSHFFNMMDDPADKKTSKYVQFIRDINRANRINIDEKIAETPNGFLKKLCQEINAQSTVKECAIAPYKAYIETKDEDKTRDNINKFFRSLAATRLENVTNDYLLPRGNLEVTQKDLKVMLPNEFFYTKNKNDKSDVSFFINNIEQNLTYDYEKKTYMLMFKVTPHSGSFSSDFKFLGEYHDMLKGKQVVGEIDTKKDEVKYFEFFLYPDKMEVKVYLTLSLIHI